MNKFFSIYFSLIIFFLFISYTCVICVSYADSNSNLNSSNDYYFSNSEFFWPVPGYHTISSYFGNRDAPAQGASKYHSGIDIPGAEGTVIFAVLSGKVILSEFYGANGHSIIIKSNEFEIQYSHISPNYIVKVRRFY